MDRLHTYEYSKKYAILSVRSKIHSVTTPTPTDAQLVNALVGEAVKLLSSAGASADILGAFAVGYPAKVMELVGKPRPEQEAVDLEQLVLDTMTSCSRSTASCS